MDLYGALRERQASDPTWPALFAVTVFLTLANVLATAGGIGGGGLFVPILSTIYDVHDAVPLSKALIFVVNLMVLVANFRLVDFETVAMMQPAGLAGTIVGVYVNLASPSWLLMVLLATVLSFSTWRTLAKAIAMWRNETRQSLLTEARYEAVSEADEDVGEDDDRTLTAGSSRLVSVVGSAKGSPRPAEVVDAEVVPGSTDQEIPDIGPMANSSSMPMRTIPFNLSSLETELEFSGAAISESNVFYFVAIAVTFVSLTVASLTKAFLSETSTHTHALNLIPLFISLFVAGLVSWFVLARDRVRGRPVWSLHGRWWITLLATFISGIGASALGVGGGIFFSPLLLEISPNPDPVRVSALSSTLVLFTAASSALQYAVLGKLHMATVLWYSFFMVGSGAFALWATRRIIAVFGRKSIIVICLGIGLGVSAIMALEQFIQGLFF